MSKIVLITGASSGIGKSAACQLLSEGYVVYGAARRVDRMSNIEGVRPVSLDITSSESISSCVEEIISEEGRIDILVNNAGYGSYGAIEDVPIEEARQQFEVNIFGLARLTQLVLPYMRDNSYGKILNISSMGGKIYIPMGGWYHATKFALEGLSDCLRFEAKPFGIDVIVIEPGGIKTEWADIAVDKLLETSASGAYSSLANRIASSFKRIYNDPKISEPQVIANVISKAIKAKRPKTRYVAGHMAKMYLFFRHILSDRMFDSLIESSI